VSTENLEIAKSLYQYGKAAWENGYFSQAVDHLEKASALLASQTPLGGEVNLWLATAYEANGRTTEAIAICQDLIRHPHDETRHQAQQLVYILQAPKLKRPPKWMSEIPDLGELAENKPQVVITAKPKISPSRQQAEPPKYVDLSQINTKDNRFIWVALMAVGLTVSYLIWLSF
jgi:tetratricopeptide (TPR) repeat protein